MIVFVVAYIPLDTISRSAYSTLYKFNVDMKPYAVRAG